MNITDSNFEQMKSNFRITDDELHALLKNKDSQSIFILFVMSFDYKYNSEYPFKKLGYSMFTNFEESIRGYNNLYDMIYHNDIIDTDIKDLFSFGTRRLARNIIGTEDLL